MPPDNGPRNFDDADQIGFVTAAQRHGVINGLRFALLVFNGSGQYAMRHTLTPPWRQRQHIVRKFRS
jgi:hypothetical protein